jgi:hypothetical protein
MFKRFAWYGMVVLLALLTASAADFTLRDFLGRQWENEVVTYPLTDAQAKLVDGGKALVGPGETAVPYQAVLLPSKARGIAFQANVPVYGSSEYKFTFDPAATATDLKIDETADLITITNGKTGIRLRKALANGVGPLAGVRLTSGTWAGDSALQSDGVADYTATVTARGPVFAEVLCSATLANNARWTLRVRVEAKEPVVLVDETSDVDGKALFSVNLSKGFTPDTLLFRYGKQVPEGGLNKNETWKLAPGEVFVMQPWLAWAERVRQGSCFSLYRENGDDLLTMAACFASTWVDPTIPYEKQADVRTWVKQDDSGVHTDFVLKHGRRAWMLAALPKTPCLTQVQPPAADAAPGVRGAPPVNPHLYESPLPYQYLIKHGQFPLDMVKNYTLNWTRTNESYPHMLLTKADVERFRKSVADPAPYQAAIPRYISDPNPLGQWNSEGPISAYFATGDAKLGKYLAKGAIKMMQSQVDCFLKQNDVPPLGSAPHHFQGIGVSMTLADVALSTDALTPEERERLLAQAAFIGYTVSRPDYWSPERGFGGLPNMTTSVYGYRAAAACLIPSHPLAQNWVKATMEELKSQLENWSDSNGGWLEAPHYAMVSYDQILSAFVMAHNAGLNDYIFLPKVKTVANWFSKISCPPDSRLGGYRHLVSAGNTYLQEATGEFGLLANIFRDKDPAFAAQMQWMFKEHRSWPEPGTGGGYPGFAGFRGLLRDPNLPAKPPAWGSEIFPRAGVALHANFPSPQATMLYMIAGDFRSHYDDDSGSVIIYGKGRAVVDDFGYYNPACSDHNMVDSGAISGLMFVKDSQFAKNLDYVQGTKGAWTRQIALVKDPDPMGPNYFVFCDSFPAPLPATWRLHFYADAVTPQGQLATATGKEDVDTDIFFLQPGDVKMTMEAKTRRANSGITADGRPSAIDMMQIALSATGTAWPRRFTAVVYPRHKLQAKPVYTTLADGRGVKIAHEYGTDYVFLAQAPFMYKDGDIAFTGMAGAIRIRNGKATLTMGSGGSISYKGQTVTSKKPLPEVKDSSNLFWDGDFECGEQRVFVADSQQYGVTATLVKGNPAKDPEHTGNYCAALTRGDSPRGVTWTTRRLMVDPTKVFRISAKVYSSDAMTADFYGYGNGDKGQLPNWQYNLTYYKGPTTGWQTLEATIGPKGSGAKYTWPDGITWVGFGCTMGGKGTLYVDDVSLEVE